MGNTMTNMLKNALQRIYHKVLHLAFEKQLELNAAITDTSFLSTVAHNTLHSDAFVSRVLSLLSTPAPERLIFYAKAGFRVQDRLSGDC